MQVTSKQTLIFRVAGQKDYVLRPTQHPVTAPEHIRGTQLYKLATSDGTVQEFVPVPAAPVDDSNAKAEADAKAAADAEAAQKATEEKAAADAAEAEAAKAAAKKAK